MNSSTIRAQNGARPLSKGRPTGRQLVGGLGVGIGTGLLASLCSTIGTPGWYGGIVKPQWAPASWMFSPFQLAVFGLMGAALSFLWASQAPSERKRVVLFWFWAQLALGLVWSFSFFVLHSTGIGYSVVMALWCAVAALMWTGSRISRTAFWLMAPLFLWVTFTSSLTFAILSFNMLREESAVMDADPRNANSPADPPIIVKKK